MGGTTTGGAGQDGVDLNGGEPGAVGRDVPQDVVLSDDPHGTDALVDALPAGEHDDRAAHLTGRFREVTLGGVGEIGEVEDVVCHVLLTAANPPGINGDVLPSLGVDDEDAAWANHDEVDLGAPAAGPATVGEQMVANGSERSEDLDGLPLGDFSHGIATSGARASAAARSCSSASAY